MQNVKSKVALLTVHCYLCKVSILTKYVKNSYSHEISAKISIKDWNCKN